MSLLISTTSSLLHTSTLNIPPVVHSLTVSVLLLLLLHFLGRLPLSKHLLPLLDHIRVQRPQTRGIRGENGHKRPFVPRTNNLFSFAKTEIDHRHLRSNPSWIQHIEERVAHPREPQRHLLRVTQVGRVVRVPHHLGDGPRQRQRDIQPVEVCRRVWQQRHDSKHNQQARKHLGGCGENRRLHRAGNRVVDLNHRTALHSSNNGVSLVEKQRLAKQRSQKERVEKNNRPQRPGHQVVCDKPPFGVRSSRLVWHAELGVGDSGVQGRGREGKKKKKKKGKKKKKKREVKERDRVL